jgi:hypothetical protein
MRALSDIRQVCTAALDEDDPQGIDAFRRAADPASVLEMATMLESLLLYVEKLDDLTAQELAREIRHRTNGEVAAEGGV